MPVTESLTVEITADSGPLESELERVGSLVDGLSTRLSNVSQLAGAAAGSLSQFGGAVAPANQLSAALDGVATRLNAIRQTQVSIDVSAALSALAQLSAAIARVAQQLASLNAIAAVPRAGGLPGALPFSGTGPRSGGSPSPPRFASGGFVAGPSGNDRVAAYVTAGEFVVRPEVVARMGRPFFEQINAGVVPSSGRMRDRVAFPVRTVPTNGRRLVSPDAVASSVSRSSNAVTSLAQDVTIQVSEAVELDDVLDALADADARQLERFG